MKGLKKTGTWFLLLNKRFLKKYMFTALLLSVTLLVLGIRLLGQEESGILTVLLYQEDNSDTQSVVDTLLEKDGLVQYVEIFDAKQGREMVENGEADCLWIFPKNLKEKIDGYLKEENEHVMEVFVKEDTVQTRLVREQLYGTLYHIFSYEITENFVADQYDLLGLKEEQVALHLPQFYEDNHLTGDLLTYTYLDGTKQEEEQEDTSYLVAPIRGLLAVLVLLCAMAVTLFYMQDEKEQIFLWMPVKSKGVFPILYILVGTLNGAIVALAGLGVSGLFTTWKREVLLLGLYVFGVVLFCNMLHLLCKNMWAFGAVMPILLIVTLVLCPVFISFRRFPVIQYLLPTYYYLSGLYSVSMIEKMGIYVGILCLVNLILSKIRQVK